MLKLLNQSNSFAVKRGPPLESPLAYDHHCQIVEGYLHSHTIRHHSIKTFEKEKRFLQTWFQEYGIHGRPLYFWEAMEPVVGRGRIVDYGKTLLESGISTNTIRAYLGILSRFFSYILEHPFVKTRDNYERLTDLYGRIDHPVSEYDIPTHVYDGELLGVPMDPEQLYELYGLLKNHYLSGSSHLAVRARNYTMFVIAAESGLRSDELLHLEVRDLFFESCKIQTRHAKGTSGSGKRSRLTLFTPLARDTAKYYLKEHREYFLRGGRVDSSLLFLSSQGRILSYTSASDGLHKMLDTARRAKFPIASHMSWHWTRRIFSTRFIERFPNQLSVLVRLLGHTSAGTVHRYIRHSEAWMDKQIQSVLEGENQTWPSIGD